jgi:hypothetical protein
MKVSNLLDEDLSYQEKIKWQRENLDRIEYRTSAEMKDGSKDQAGMPFLARRCGFPGVIMFFE